MVVPIQGKKSLWIAVASAGVSVVMLLGVMKLITSEISTVRTQKIILAGLHNDLNLLDAMLQDTKRYESEIQTIARTIPKGYGEVAQSIGALEQVAKLTNVVINELTIDDKPKPETNGLFSLSIGLNSSGRYTDIHTFLTNVSRLPYHTRIDALQFDSALNKITADITIRLYIQEYE